MSVSRCVHIALVAALAIGCAEPNQYQPPPPPPVKVARPLRQTVTDYQEETGVTEAVEMVAVRARVRGFLQEVLFEAGSRVEKGDTLYLIQPQEYEAKVSAAEAEVRSMEVALNLAEIEYKRQENLIAGNATAQSNVDQTRAARDAAAASLQASRASLDQAKLDLTYTKVTTPIAGRVGKTLVKVGNLVGDNEATHLTTVVGYDPIYANFSISERALLAATKKSDDSDPSDITQVKALLRRSSDDGFPFEGHLEYADLAVDESTGTFMIRAVFPNPDLEIFPGLFVRVRIPLDQIENAVLLPERALGADQGGRFVIVVGEDNTAERRNVEPGGKYDGLVVISAGLTGEERVVIDGIQRARPGAEVSPEEIELSPVDAELHSVGQSSDAPVTEGAAEIIDAVAPADEPEENAPN